MAKMGTHTQKFEHFANFPLPLFCIFCVKCWSIRIKRSFKVPGNKFKKGKKESTLLESLRHYRAVSFHVYFIASTLWDCDKRI